MFDENICQIKSCFHPDHFVASSCETASTVTWRLGMSSKLMAIRLAREVRHEVYESRHPAS